MSNCLRLCIFVLETMTKLWRTEHDYLVYFLHFTRKNQSQKIFIFATVLLMSIQLGIMMQTDFSSAPAVKKINLKNPEWLRTSALERTILVHQDML